MRKHLSQAGKNLPDADIFHKKKSLSISVLILQKLLTFIKAYNKKKIQHGNSCRYQLVNQTKERKDDESKEKDKTGFQSSCSPCQTRSQLKKEGRRSSQKVKAKTVKAVNKKVAKVVKAAKPKVAAKKPAAAQGTVLSSVLSTVKRSKNGVAIAKIKEKTGLSPRQLSNALYKLSKSGKIASKERGVYIAK